MHSGAILRTPRARCCPPGQGEHRLDHMARLAVFLHIIETHTNNREDRRSSNSAYYSRWTLDSLPHIHSYTHTHTHTHTHAHTHAPHTLYSTDKMAISKDSISKVKNASCRDTRTNHRYSRRNTMYVSSVFIYGDPPAIRLGPVRLKKGHLCCQTLLLHHQDHPHHQHHRMVWQLLCLGPESTAKGDGNCQTHRWFLPLHHWGGPEHWH